MNYGYVRESKSSLGVEKQKELLIPLTDKLVCEKNKERTDFSKLMKNIGNGDCLYVTELSRIGISTKSLVDICDKLMEKGVYLISLKDKIDTRTKEGELIISSLKVFLEYERECVRERQNEGIARALSEGRKWGKKSEYSVDTDKGNNIFTKYLNKEIRAEDAAKELGLPYQVYLRQFKKWQRDNGLENIDLRSGNGRKFVTKE